MGATELPNFRPADQLSIEDREHGADDSLSHEKGNTTRDEVEMSRMGKKQELRVSSSQCYSSIVTDFVTANV